jgi:hypothetical protein
MFRSLFESVSLRADAHQGLAVAVVVTVIAFVAAVLFARKARVRSASVLLLLVVMELIVGVYGVTRIVGPIQYYLVQWISAVAFVLWLAIGNATIEHARARMKDMPWRRTALRVVTISAIMVLCAGAVRALPSGAGRINEDLDVPNNRGLFGYVPSEQLLAATRPGETVVLRLDSLTAWEVMGADALMLVQHGRNVRIVNSTVTRLLFDDSLRVARSTPGPVLAFRDRPKPQLGAGATLVANQGEWSIVAVDG